MISLSFIFALLLSGQDIRVSCISDGEDRTVEKLTASSSKSTVVTVIMVNRCLGKHGEILDLRTTERRAVIGDENHFCLGSAHVLKSSLVSEVSLSRLHDQLDTRVHVVNGLLLFSESGGRVSSV